MFKWVLASATFAISLTSGAFAESFGELGSYSAVIGPGDVRNSSGAPLKRIGAVIQQDRANFHRFGVRDLGDQDDPVFADRANRALIPHIYIVYGDEERLEDWIGQGNSVALDFLICGSNGRPTVLAIIPQWVVDHSGCS